MSKPTNPFSELERLFEQMQRNVEKAAEMWEMGPAEEGFAGTASASVDLEDRTDEFVLTADLPGFDSDDIDVRVTDRTLHLEAEHKEGTEEEAEGEYVRRERRRASVSRSIQLPEAVETEDISASYQNGVLTVRMPKTEPVAEGKEVEIN